jgi:hypothetical protein
LLEGKSRPFPFAFRLFIGTGCSRLTIYTCGSFNEIGTRAAKGFAGGSIKRERVAGLRWDDEAGTTGRIVSNER